MNQSRIDARQAVAAKLAAGGGGGPSGTGGKTLTTLAMEKNKNIREYYTTVGQRQT